MQTKSSIITSSGRFFYHLHKEIIFQCVQKTLLVHSPFKQSVFLKIPQSRQLEFSFEFIESLILSNTCAFLIFRSVAHTNLPFFIWVWGYCDP